MWASAPGAAGARISPSVYCMNESVCPGIGADSSACTVPPTRVLTASSEGAVVSVTGISLEFAMSKLMLWSPFTVR